MLGVPVRAPVVVLKLIPGGVELMAKLAMAPPVELAVNPVAAVFTVRDSDDEVNVNAGGRKKVPDVITRLPVPLALTATNKPSPNVTERHWFLTGEFRAVQEVPFVLVAILLINPSVVTATNKLLPYVTDHQPLSAADVRLVQVTPSGLVITRLPVPLSLTATNKPLPPTVPYVTEFQLLLTTPVV